MSWFKLVIQLPLEYQEIFIAELMEMNFEGFEQFDERLEAFIPRQRFNDVHREMIEQILAAYPVDSFIETEEIGKKNWNEAWEKTVKPQEIGHFLVRPTWSSMTPSKGKILLEMDPKMAFGTGYHATTKLMLQRLPDLNPRQRDVLDAGTGTGILAIAAAKLGARSVMGFDIDEWSEINANENVLLNKVGDVVEIRKGGIATVPGGSRYDLILANIDHNTIVELIESLTEHLKAGGKLALTGLLQTDREQILEMAVSLGLSLHHEQGLEEWIYMDFEKRERERERERERVELSQAVWIQKKEALSCPFRVVISVRMSRSRF